MVMHKFTTFTDLYILSHPSMHKSPQIFCGLLCLYQTNISELLGGNFGTAGKGAAAARQAAGDTPTSRLNTRHK